MKKKLLFIGLAVLVILVLLAVGKTYNSNKKTKKIFKTEQLTKNNIVNKVVATGKIIPKEEVEIKPQISGIIDKIYFEEGAQVKKGDLLATVRVVPNEQNLISARGNVSNLKLTLSNSKISYNRSKALFDKGVIARQEFENTELAYNQAKQNLVNSQNNYQIIRRGSIGSGGSANTNIRATVSGTVLEIPIEEGDQVIQSNNFNDGTTIAIIADMTKMIFEGQVDEAEVDKLKLDMDLDITVGAIEDKNFMAKLNFIAPKGKDENGAIQFKIEGDLEIGEGSKIRANYSANASIVIQKRDSVLSIREALLQYDEETKKPYVEIEKAAGEFEKTTIELGVSDGINVEVVSGITEEDNIKVWNSERKKKKKDNE